MPGSGAPRGGRCLRGALGGGAGHVRVGRGVCARVLPAARESRRGSPAFITAVPPSPLHSQPAHRNLPQRPNSRRVPGSWGARAAPHCCSCCCCCRRPPGTPPSSPGPATRTRSAEEACAVLFHFGGEGHITLAHVCQDWRV